MNLAIGILPALDNGLGTLLSGGEVELTDGLKERASVSSH